MARTYYDTPQRVYQLFKNHPALSQMYSEFSIELDGIKRVSEFLVLNHDKIVTYDLQKIYKSATPNSLEVDQKDPIVGEVENTSDLPQTNNNQGDVYYVKNPNPGKYYIWDSGWSEDPKSRDKTRQTYIDSLYNERGYKIWEDESGFFVAIEDDGKITWHKIDNASPDYIIIRKSELPINPTAGVIYEVLGEDLIDVIASLYGLVEMGLTPPWNKYQSQRGTNLQELLNITVYLYRYGVTDNFYEKNIWQFLPEYDRDVMQAQPKMKLFMESIGRKLDQLEDKLTRLQTVYDFDETPDELLDYLGQMVGYEKEDFSLSNVSFRELLKNIIEIYKIKGTNYSFSFFFKFLGFNVNLKEFYFNRDANNPEAFPGVDEENVEFYLSTTNPIMETRYGSPATHLRSIRSLNDWKIEKDALTLKGCSNPLMYMLGRETYNNDGITWHSNPWMYFKTNLIEYQLNPFFDKINLTSSDNETIRKYIRFLSPTYLFTWINVNLLPWVEDFTISENVEDAISASLSKTFGQSDGGVFKDYENVVDYFQVWDTKSNSLLPYTEADEMIMSIVNNLNLGGDDKVGAYLRRDGVYIRQPGHPSHITNVFHDGATHLNFDNLGIMIKETSSVDYDDKYQLLSQLPATEVEDTLAFVEETGLYYIFKDPAPHWELVEGNIVVDVNHIVPSYAKLIQKQDAIIGDTYKTSDTGRFYKYYNEPAEWKHVTETEDRYKKWMDYSYRPFPAYPINVKPTPGISLKTNVIDFIWDEIYSQHGYWIQIARDVTFTNIVREEFIYDGRNYIKDLSLDNNNYYWRVRTKNSLPQLTFTEDEMLKMRAVDDSSDSYFTLDNGIYTIRVLNGFEYNELLKILSLSGNKFDWGEWSPIYRFKNFGLPFPQDGQIINDINYQHIKKIYDTTTGGLSSIKLNIEWPSATNVESYEIVVAKMADFSQVILTTPVETNYFTMDIPNGEYYWKYRMKRFNKDWQDWSNVLHFTVQL